MNDPAWYEYMQQLHQHIIEQDKKIQALTDRLDQMEHQQPPNQQTTIEKLEYHFDQLKIDRMDGTLHIGLAPEDFTKMENFSLPLRNQTAEQNHEHLIRELNNYLTRDGDAILQQLTHEYHYQLDEPNRQVLLEDIRKQLPGRVAHYKQEGIKQQIKNKQQLEAYIHQQIQAEIPHSLRLYFEKKTNKGD